MTTQGFVELHGVHKRFAGVQALQDVSLSVDKASIHALVGENGAGKSTLGKIIGGIVGRDGGDLRIEGRPVSYRAPREALADGIAVIQQELSLVPELSVAENVFLGVEPSRRGGIDRREVRRRYERLEERAGFGLHADTTVGTLSVASQQKVEILRAIARDARLIVMDEPTSSLGREETLQLHNVVRELRAGGMTIVYVTHFLEEVLTLADRVTVFRNGRVVETMECADASVERLILAMLGREIATTFPDKTLPPPDAEVVLSVRGLERARVFENIDFEIRRGEILGMAGLVGSGRSEVARAIFGADPVDGGTVTVAGEVVPSGSPRRAMAAGIGFAPEDRKKDGLLLELSQRMNVSLPHLARFTRAGMTRRGRERRETGELLRSLGVSPPDPERTVVTLSGGNQQKVLFAKWLLREPKVLILDEPTRGVDVGAKRAIYELIASLARRGMAVLVISSELEEVLGLAHRVLVMRAGRIGTELGTENLSADAVMHASFGIDALDPERTLT